MGRTLLSHNPRVYSAMGLAVSKDVALDLIIAAVEAVEGPDPARIVAKKSAPAATENEDEDDNEKDEDKDDAPKVRLMITSCFFCTLLMYLFSSSSVQVE